MIDEILNLPDVSFIDDLQLDDVQAQLVRDYQNRYKEITGKDVALERADPMSLILYALIAIPENNAKNSALQNVNYCVTDFRRTPVRLQIRSL